MSGVGTNNWLQAIDPSQFQSLPTPPLSDPLPQSAAPASTGLTQAQMAQIAAQAIGGFGSGQNTGALNPEIIAAFQAAGATPEQIAALGADQLPQGGPSSGSIWGNAPGEQSQWVNQVLAAEGQGNSAATTNAAAPPQTITPSTIAAQFPGGLPSYTPNGVGNLPAVNSQSVMGGMGGPGAYSPDAAIAATQAYLQPQFDQQDKALQAALASAGIVGGTTGQGINQLGQQQQTTLQNNIQPYLLNLKQLQQGALTTDAGNDLNAQQFNANTALQGGEFNATQSNQGQQFNIQNLLQTGQIDAATANQMSQFLMQQQQNAWQSQLGVQAGLTGNTQNQSNNAFQPIYQQPAQTNLAGVGSAFGSNYRQTQPTGGFSAPADPSFGAAGKAA